MVVAATDAVIKINAEDVLWKYDLLLNAQGN